MARSFELEILDGHGVPEAIADRSYREMTKIHRFLGNTRYLVQAIRRDPLPVGRILDVGCGNGGVLEEVSKRLAVDCIGVDISPRRPKSLPILKADAVHDRLPDADVAYSTLVAHHLSDIELVQMIQNVGRSCRRFIVLDLVRGWAPLALFQIFVAPLVSPVSARDGQTSIRRGYTPQELHALVAHALAGSSATFRQSVATFGVRQTIDICYAGK